MMINLIWIESNKYVIKIIKKTYISNNHQNLAFKIGKKINYIVRKWF